ncbi:MAG: response regulator [Deltaproteobacteria bacterium]|nr:response regulator [Deltaproteobacteria bacterium]
MKRAITERKRAAESLQKSRNELEQRVKERTMELTKINEQLKDEIQERKRAEEALRVSGEKYRSLVESTEDSIYLIDSYCTYLFMNGKHLSRFSLPEDKVIGKTYGEFHSEEKTKVLTEKVNQVLKTGKSVLHEYRSERDGGYFLRTLSPVKGADGRAIAVTVISKDITERKHLEAQLQYSQRMEAIGTLAGGIAHDFNNVLMGILGHASLVSLDTDTDHPHFEHLKGIEDMVQGGADLTRQLLGFARGGKYEVKPTDLNELIEKSSEMFGRTKKEIKIHTKHQKEIWPVEVDQAQIEQVLLNVYVNAWQAMPHGGNLYIETSNVELYENYTKPFGVEPGNYGKISVTDTGIGMDKAMQQSIFDPFFTTREMGRGTGLGLSSAYGIIKNHDGIINVYSEKGKGATFNIYLPASKKELPMREDRLPDEILKGTETLLLVDDEGMILGVGEEMLKKMGYGVLLATSGNEAVELCKKHKNEIDLVILDMIMPDMGGGEAYDRMKENNSRVKVLLSSGYSIQGQATEILERGCDGFIQKPFNVKELSGKIREILDKK